MPAGEEWADLDARLPYQASPIVVAMGMERVPARDGVRLCLAMAAATLVLLPLDYAWFRITGWIA